jgi:hypothetical protein
MFAYYRIAASKGQLLATLGVMPPDAGPQN